MDNRELFEFQESTMRQFRKVIRNVGDRLQVSKATEKQIETIVGNLETYEIMHDTLIKVREAISVIMKSEELDTIEKEIKFLNDTFWD